MGLSTRTIWRHFRSKESCAEPIVTQGVEWEMSTPHSWPPQLSLEVHFAAESNRFGHEASGVERMDTALAVKMIRLADTEPAIRTAWLMACDQVEREMAEIIAQRLRLPAEDNWFTYVGDPADPEQEADMLARSPIRRVDQIRTPLMVVHGANDARVALAESEQLVEALRARGVPVEYTVMEDEGHAIENPENVIALYAAAERFLAEHLGFEAHKA